MFDIGFSELLLIAVVALVVMGPQRLPQAMRTLALWLGRARQMFNNLRRELENEVGMDDVRRQLHNEQVLRDLKHSAEELDKLGADVPAAADPTDPGEVQPEPVQKQPEPPEQDRP
ncbi:MAG: twin-arginine translocase subunit TatB [Gammaproteobacteria bacterium]|nr:MAG: twin-arginine translocase subunit TatB [Gammaproteobacteria bacterium]